MLSYYPFIKTIKIIHEKRFIESIKLVSKYHGIASKYDHLSQTLYFSTVISFQIWNFLSLHEPKQHLWYLKIEFELKI